MCQGTQQYRIVYSKAEYEQNTHLYYTFTYRAGIFFSLYLEPPEGQLIIGAIVLILFKLK